MKRSGLSVKILLVAFLNLFILGVVFLTITLVQFRVDLGSFLLGPARYRIVTVSREAAFELASQPRERWSDTLAQYSSIYPASFFLFDDDGTQLAGPQVKPPDSILFDHRPPPAPPFDGQRPPHPHSQEPGPPNPQRGPPHHGGPGEVRFDHTIDPPDYWAVVHIPLPSKPGAMPFEASLVWRFRSLWTNTFFFDYKPLLITVVLIVAISVACWLPLIRSLTRTISTITAATGQIAGGHFEVKLPVRRRDELGRLSESINQMAQSLAGYVNGQRRFLGDIAHELCSPVARIQLSLGILEQRSEDANHRYIETIDEEVQHMSTLLNELLSFSKASLGATAAPEAVRVKDSVERAIERERLDGVIIHVDVPASLLASAQPEYLLRSISNVLRNAIRYAGAHGPIEISARQVNDFAVVTVADQGPGVPAAELEEILKPFYRPESARQRETGGVGLGLAIVRSCMEACGGSVTCRNRMPNGFEVDLRLRLAVVPPVT